MISRSSSVWLTSFLAFSSLQWAPKAQAVANPGENLDLFLRASDHSSGRVLSPDDCLALRLISESRDSDVLRWQKRAQSFYQAHCGEKQESTANAEDSTARADKSADALWDGTALCSSDDARLIHCEHRGESGRGLFVYSGRDSLENSPTLVCAHFEATYRSPFEQEQQIAARCVVTEFDWRYEGQRSDVYGVKNWLYQKTGHSPLQIPGALKSQCAEVFPDALYCTPTLIVFPDSDSTRLSTCQLNTHDRVVGLGAVLRVGSWNSRWVCESKSLVTPDKDTRLSVEERSCVPDHLWQHKTSYCEFP